MSRLVLADTGPLYALADRSDQFHSRARRESEQLKLEGFVIAAAHPTIMEGHTLILRRLGLQVARAWLEDAHSRIGLINPTPADYLDAVRQVRTFRDKPISLFDALLAVLSERLGLPIWSFDRHFELMHVNLWRGR